jgi:hypothetical protein
LDFWLLCRRRRRTLLWMLMMLESYVVPQPLNHV